MFQRALVLCVSQLMANGTLIVPVFTTADRANNIISGSGTIFQSSKQFYYSSTRKKEQHWISQVSLSNSFHVIIFQRPPAKRYWPDSWEMKFWRQSCCDSLLRSKNCFARFWAKFFVAPLTNVTGLSLYYQLYLTEIFHLRFGTKLGHYICMVRH